MISGVMVDFVQFECGSKMVKQRTSARTGTTEKEEQRQKLTPTVMTASFKN